MQGKASKDIEISHSPAANAATLQDIFEKALESVSRLDQQAQYLSVNHRYSEIFDYRPEEMIGMSWYDTVYKDDIEHARQLFNDMLEVGRSEAEIRCLRKDSNIRYLKIVLLKGLPTPNASVDYYYCFIEDITEWKQEENNREIVLKALQESEDRFAKAIKICPDMIALTRLSDGLILDVNDSFLKTTGWNKDEVIGRTTLDINLYPNPNSRKKYVNILKEEGKTVDFEVEYLKKNGEQSLVLASNVTVVVDGETCVFTIGRDIAERKRSENLLYKTNRALKVLSQCNNALIHIEDEVSLLDEICNIVVKIGGYRFAWVGYAVNDDDKTILPISYSGYEQGYLDNRFTWGDSPYGKGPAGQSISNNKTSIIRNINTSKEFEPWRNAAIDRGYASVISMPLIIDGQVEGGLLIYSSEIGAFDSEEQELLENLASNLSYGIQSLRAKDKQRIAEELLSIENKAYEILSSDNDLDILLAKIVLLLEDKFKEIQCNVLLVDNEKDCLSSISAHNLADDFIDLENNCPIEEGAGCCGTAAYLKELVIVDDISTHSYYENYRPIKDKSYVKACWSLPFLSSTGELLGVFACYYTKPRKPNQNELDLIQHITNIIAPAIERKNTQGLIKESEERFRRTFEYAAFAKALVSKDGIILEVNYAFCRMLGYEEDELINKHINEITCNEDIATTEKNFFSLINGYSDGFEVENRFLHKDGHIVWVLISASIVRSDDEVAYCIAQVRDITEWKKAEIRETRLGRILEDSLHEVYVFEVDKYKFIMVNRGGRENTGYCIDELTEMTPLDLLCDMNKSEFDVLLAPLQDGDKEQITLFAKHKRKDGTSYDIEVSIQHFNISGTSQYVAMVQDITERKQAERALMRYKRIVSATNDYMAFISNDYKYLAANQQYIDAFGIGIKDIINLHVKDVVGQGAFQHLIKPRIDKCLKGEQIRVQEWIALPSGLRYLDIQYNPFNDTDNIITGVVTSVRDITDLERARQALWENEERFRLISLATHDALYDWDLKINDVWKNDAYIKSFSNLKEISSPNDWIASVHPDDQDYVMNSLANVLKYKHQFWSAEYRLEKSSGEYANILDRAYIIYDKNGKPVRIMGAMIDITERKKAELALLSSEERFRSMYEDHPLMLFTINEKGEILSINKHVTNQLGYTNHELEHNNISLLVEEHDCAKIFKSIEQCVKNSEYIDQFELQIKQKNQSYIWVRQTIRAIHDSNGQDRILIVSENISETIRLSEQLSHQASHDSLTGLVNRTEFEQRLEQTINDAKNDQTEHALCYLDLDQFKVINDTCGHLAGDELLRQISELLKGTVRKSDTIARLGGDEFGILMVNCTLEQAHRAANNMRKLIDEFRYIWAEKRYTLGVSIGLVPITSESISITSVLKDADAACFAAKEAGRNRVHIYRKNDSELSRLHGEMQWVSKITDALEENRFHLYYQKIQDLSSKNEKGEMFEILTRMEDEDGNIVSPGAFMPAAERYNLMVKIDTWVINNLIQWLLDNPQRLEDLELCTINISGQSIGDTTFLNNIVDVFQNENIPTEKLCLEITETAAIANMNNALKLIRILKGLGCSFALDDFGSGVSSFGYLKNLPVDYLKIDGTFVRDILVDPIDYEMVRSINDIGKVMGKKTIAEFVESKEIQDKLCELGIDYAQGYAIEKPMPLIKSN